MNTNCTAHPRFLLLVAIALVTFAAAYGANSSNQPQRVRIATVSMRWNPERRTLENVLSKIAEAAACGADIVAFPMQCIITGGEPIPGPISRSIANAAKDHDIHVIANIRERDGEKNYITSFLIDDTGKLLGTYRKTHRLPHEKIDLGQSLPVFDTRFGTLAMKIGTDRYFPEIDYCYAVKRADICFWAQKCEVVEDEVRQDRAVEGNALDFAMTYVCSRYATKEGEPFRPNWLPRQSGSPIGYAYVVNKDGRRCASTLREGGIAIANLRCDRLSNTTRKPEFPHFKTLLRKTPPEKPKFKTRSVRVGLTSRPYPGLLDHLHRCGRENVDIVFTYEHVWIAYDGSPDKVRMSKNTAAKKIRRVRSKAREYGMYVFLSGFLREPYVNEAMLINRDGKIVLSQRKTYQRPGTRAYEYIPAKSVRYYDTEFGRLGAYICADTVYPAIVRCLYALDVDIVYFPTQEWGLGAATTERIEIARALQGGMFLMKVNFPSSESLHSSKIVTPSGVVLERQNYNDDESIIISDIDLDKHQPKYGGSSKGARDLYDVIRDSRRPELYAPILFPENSEN